MNIECRAITANEYCEAKRLWSICFPEDGYDFIDYYYRRRTNHRQVYAAFSDGKMLCMMHIIPQTLLVDRIKKPVAFIAGIGTLPQYRRMGICRQLFDFTFKQLLKQNISAAVLQPFDTAFYAQFGFLPFVTHYRANLNHASFCASEAITPFTPSCETLLCIYNKYVTQRFRVTAERNESTFSSILEEFCTFGYAVRYKDAYAFGYGDYVQELVGNDNDVMHILMYLVSKYPTVSAPFCSSGAFNASPEIFNMIKVLDPKTFFDGTGFTSPTDLSVQGVSFTLDKY